ncbi:MAG: hypothetical protein Q8P57_03615 [Candidatus Pacearchaeota archaeon]|nr:hypothetical protein [Candidatus Pacearchaeota archaeon]
MERHEIQQTLEEHAKESSYTAIALENPELSNGWRLGDYLHIQRLLSNKPGIFEKAGYIDVIHLERNTIFIGGKPYSEKEPLIEDYKKSRRDLLERLGRPDFKRNFVLDDIIALNYAYMIIPSGLECESREPGEEGLKKIPKVEYEGAHLSNYFLRDIITLSYLAPADKKTLKAVQSCRVGGMGILDVPHCLRDSMDDSEVRKTYNSFKERILELNEKIREFWERALSNPDSYGFVARSNLDELAPTQLIDFIGINPQIARMGHGPGINHRILRDGLKNGISNFGELGPSKKEMQKRFARSLGIINSDNEWDAYSEDG